MSVLDLEPLLQPYYSKLNYLFKVRPVNQDTLQMYVLFKLQWQYLVYCIYFTTQIPKLPVAVKRRLLPDSLIFGSIYCPIASTFSLLRWFAILRAEVGGNIVEKLVKPGANLRFVPHEELFDAIHEKGPLWKRYYVKIYVKQIL